MPPPPCDHPGARERPWLVSGFLCVVMHGGSIWTAVKGEVVRCFGIDRKTNIMKSDWPMFPRSMVDVTHGRPFGAGALLDMDDVTRLVTLLR